MGAAAKAAPNLYKEVQVVRKLMWFTIGFGAACAFCSYCYVNWMLWAFLGCIFTGIVFAAAARFCTWFAHGALVILGVGLGFGWFWVHDSAYLSQVKALDGKTITVTVTASDFNYATDYGTAVEGSIRLEGKTYRVKLYLDGDWEIYPGSQINGAFSVRFTAEGGHKDPTFHRSEGIFLLLYQRGAVDISEPEEIAVRYYPAVWRELLLKKIDALFPTDAAGFAKALLVGDRTGIDYETNTAFKVSGISHIIAVSGLHVSILFGLLYTVTLRKRWLTGLIGIPGMLLFAAVVGFTPSVTRACIMQILMLVAMMSNKEYDPPTALSFAVIVMLAVNPMTAASISFQLSVGCMVGIFLFSEKIREYLENKWTWGSGKDWALLAKLKHGAVSSVSVSIGAAVVTTPLVAYYFGTVSLVGVLTNLLTLWVISFIFYGIVLVLLIGLLWPGVGCAIAGLISWAVRYVLLTAKVLSEFPMAAVYTESIYIVFWLIGCYGMLTVFLLCKKRYPLVLGSCAAVSLCIAMLLSWFEPLSDSLRVTVLDVGQGQCILLQSEGRTYMVDCGGDSETVAADKAAETLLSQGIDHLDGIILTHYDTDHAGGVAHLLTRVQTDALYLPDMTDDSGTSQQLANLAESSIKYIDEDIRFILGQTVLTIFAPETKNLDNESGLCVLFQRGNCDILITGDRGELGEMLLLRRPELPQLEVLIAGHHGSGSSTGEELLKETAPQTVIISVGQDNSYGHPAKALLDRLARYGCTVYRTDENGTIIYRR